MCVITTTKRQEVEQPDGTFREVTVVLAAGDDPWVWGDLDGPAGISFPAANSPRRAGEDLADVAIPGWNVDFGEEALVFMFPQATESEDDQEDDELWRNAFNHMEQAHRAHRRRGRVFVVFAFMRQFWIIDYLLDAFGIDLGSFNIAG
jgi:hypothetical protein